MEDKVFDLLTKMYNEIQDMKSDMNDMKSEIKDMKSDMNDMKSEIKVINKKLDEKADKSDIVRLEHTLGDKIEALFDAGEIQIDRDTEVATNLKRVENKVDKLELKVIRNSLRKN